MVLHFSKAYHNYPYGTILLFNLYHYILSAVIIYPLAFFVDTWYLSQYNE